MSAAAIARMVRELRGVAFPGEQHPTKSAAAWAAGADFMCRQDFGLAGCRCGPRAAGHEWKRPGVRMALRVIVCVFVAGAV